MVRKLLVGITLAVAMNAAAQTNHRVVIEVTSGSIASIEMVLGNVENLRKAFAPEHVDIEVVCLGNGLDMLTRKANSHAGRIATMNRLGIRFAACSNTMHYRKIQKSELISGTSVVDSGVAEVVRKEEAGWSYLKGGL